MRASLSGTLNFVVLQAAVLFIVSLPDSENNP
jgi:hypothetical protein